MNGVSNGDEMNYIVERIHDICGAEDVTAATKIDALKLLLKVCELQANINMNAMMMGMRSDDRK